ncbi:MAG: hypothetical protein LBM26_02540 [Methanobrevibacter sp.]|jgi:hypothetical protein|nr:hypothetical protein [Methanobrevibacter sp.]
MTSIVIDRGMIKEEIIYNPVNCCDINYNCEANCEAMAFEEVSNVY